MRKKFVSCIITLTTFLTWFTAGHYYQEYSSVISNANNLIVPAIWSIFIIWLYNKGYLYFALNSYILFLFMLFADAINFESHSRSVERYYMFLCFLLAFAAIFIQRTLNQKRSATIIIFAITVILYAIPFIFVAYAINFNTYITKDVFYAISQTNISESFEFASEYISSTWLIVAAVIVLAVALFLAKQEKVKSHSMGNRTILVSTIILLIAGISRYDDNRIYTFSQNAVRDYIAELKAFNETQKKLENNEIKFNAIKKEKDEVHIIVIGESLNKNHMSIYGYIRDTNPILGRTLDKHNSVQFENAISSHTHTMPVLSQALTESNQLNQKDYFTSLSIIDITKKAAAKSYWVTNQPLYGIFENLVTVIALKSSNLVQLNRSIGSTSRTQRFDGEAIMEVSNILSKKTSSSKVIFIHLMGNHADYCSRYPQRFQKFYGKLDKGVFGSLHNKNDISRDVNCYDNSVLYNDFVIGRIIKNLQSRKDQIATITYLSDHADDVINMLGHNSGQFTYEMTQIPFFIWFSEKYEQRYPKKISNLKENREKLFTNDFLYDTLIGLLNLKTERYESKRDLTSTHYKLTPRETYTLHKKKPYIDKNNHIWWQASNIEKINDAGEEKRLIPHRVNSIGKLNDIWLDGARSFETDAIFSDSERKFYIGHDKDKTGKTFEEILTAKTQNEAGKIWLDFKNLSSDNYQEALNRLNYLDNKFNIKKKLIVESSTQSSYFKKFSQAGWHTSYYLPTVKILNYLEERKTRSLSLLANSINKQLRQQELKAVSFDYRLYPFVKDHLEPLIPENIIYHTWDLSEAFYHKNLTHNLANKEYYNDKRVDTILLTYKSNFNL